MSQPAAMPALVPEARPASSHAGEGAAVLLTVLVLPLALYADHLAAYGRLLYPLTNLLLAAYLYARRSPWYAGHCVLVFCFASLVRRLVDEQAGWDPSSPVLLAPYLCCLFAGITFIEYWSRPRPRAFAPFLILIGAVIYGAVLAVLNGRMLGAGIDLLKWSVGPLFAVHLLAQHEDGTHTRRVVEGCLVWAGAAMSAYGVIQYLDPPSWDALWMRNASDMGFTSIGQPEPFGVRVFSTMNSPGSFGTFLCAGIVLALKRTPPATAFTVSLMIVGLALCQYRTLWAVTALAVVLSFASRHATPRPGNVLALLAVVLVLSSSAVVPRIRETVVQRAATLTALKNDESLESRMHQYAVLMRSDGLIIGEGLGVNRAPTIIDGGLIEIALALGLVVGVAYLSALITLVASLFTAGGGIQPHLPFDRAIAVATLLQLPMGSVHVGELGFCAWLFLGLALAARRSAP